MVPAVRALSRILSMPALAVSGVLLAVSLAGAVLPPADSLNIAAPFWWLPLFATLALIAWLVRRSRPYAFVLLGGYAVIGAILFAPLFPAPRGASAAAPVRIVTFNMNGLNPRGLDAARWILRQNPDFVVLLEATPFQHRATELIAEQLPHVHNCSSGARCSTKLFARIPAQEVWPLARGDADNRQALSAVTARFPTASGPLSITAVHLQHPWPLGNQAGQIGELASALTAYGRHGVMTGDFNSAPWTFAMRRLSANGELSLVSGARGTWPALAPALLRLPLDQVYVGRCLSLKSIRRGPAFGSDHVPIVTDIAPATCHG